MKVGRPPIAGSALVALTLALATTAVAPSAHAQLRGAGRVGVELQPFRRWEFTLTERAVFGDRVPDTGRYQTMLEAAYDPTSFLRLGGGYRIAFSEGFGGVAIRHRLHLEARLDTRWRFFRFAYRLRWQNAFEDRPLEFDFDSYLRNRASVYFRTPHAPLEFDVNAELYSQLDATAQFLGRFRFEGGVTLRLRRVEIGAHYRYDTPLEGDGHEYHMVLGSLLFNWEAPRPHPNRERRRQERERREREREASPQPAAPASATASEATPAAPPSAVTTPPAPPSSEPAVAPVVTPSALPLGPTPSTPTPAPNTASTP